MKRTLLTIMLIFVVINYSFTKDKFYECQINMFYEALPNLNKKVGVASFYHDKFHGRKTASGELFNQNAYTAAHKTLPFGTKLLIKNLSNNKEVIVVVNDRGPFIKGRSIDLSKAAAKELNFISKGIQKIEYTVLNDSNKNHFLVN